ncbi:MAG: D-tagatose-bisphosphate aldolase, class II, non-catalytic subunit, partial [Paracoccaceae bacterium]|nr:D-tagatose-bisphosphate aldolase, class II, non-catalytic subunit [Paracoccaceae bacterium]
ASICSEHSLVIEAAFLHSKAGHAPVLIEATCNQVNQDGGYTGMSPADFRRFVEGIAQKTGFDTSRLILGGDHLGPNPWRHLPADEALGRAEIMIAAYVRAGFTKLHLDTSMGCAGESAALPDAVTATRAARLAQVAEAAAANSGFDAPVYVIGTEVPIPGGAMEALDHLQVTTPQAALDTVDVHRRAFARLGLDAAFARVIGLVVQPGVEFGNENVIFYDRPAAKGLSAIRAQIPQLVFEAHSTDYQPLAALRALVDDGFAILKVGPGLTYALREALYGLDSIASFQGGVPQSETLQHAMEQLMLREPKNWANYYHGNAADLRLQRHFSYSDRIRYYWPHVDAKAAVNALMARLSDKPISETLISQYIGALYPAVAKGRLVATPRNILVAHVQSVIETYARACHSVGEGV